MTKNIPDPPGRALPGMGVEPTMPAQYARLVERMLDYCERATAGLTVEQLCDTRGGITNSIGFDVWHVVRTTDNIIHFVFEREQPVWITGGFYERWGLPKVDQGTGMDPNDAYSMRFPEPEEFDRYTRAVKEAVVPRIAGMSMEYLETPAHPAVGRHPADGGDRPRAHRARERSPRPRILRAEPVWARRAAVLGAQRYHER